MSTPDLDGGRIEYAARALARDQLGEALTLVEFEMLWRAMGPKYRNSVRRKARAVLDAAAEFSA